MKKYIAHGRISVYEHSLNVARLSYKMFSFLKLKDEESLVAGALLHDYYLYDTKGKITKNKNNSAQWEAFHESL